MIPFEPAPVEQYRVRGEWIEQRIGGKWVQQVEVAGAVRLAKQAIDKEIREARLQAWRETVCTRDGHRYTVKVADAPRMYTCVNCGEPGWDISGD